LFTLKPVKAAKVSEISEATAAAPVNAKERVNFHIGNPVQDASLNQIYRNLACQAELMSNEDEGLAGRGWSEANSGLLKQSILDAVPYSPRGGYHRSDPNELAVSVKEWLVSGQSDALEYDIGEESGIREMIFSSGGNQENLRVFFYMLKNYLVHLPARILLYDVTLPEHLMQVPSLVIEELNEEEIGKVEDFHDAAHPIPIFLVMGGKLSEHIRRSLRRLSFSLPLFFVEMNDCENQFSMAREAGLLNRVLRFVSPGAIQTALAHSSLSLVLGNAEYLKRFEMVHFELKGTPATTEITLLTHLLKQTPSSSDDHISENNDHTLRLHDTLSGRIGARASDGIARRARQMDELFQKTSKKIEKFADVPDRIMSRVDAVIDPFSALDSADLFAHVLKHIDKDQVHTGIASAFTNAFLTHHPHYNGKSCALTSGSNRTALSLLGYHCGISDVIIPDLSWTYEHCFPHLTAVPLMDDLSLDPEAITSAVKGKIARDPEWKRRGAVIFNNPHNASGRVQQESDIIPLLTTLLRDGVFVIDDLAYDNVAPVESPVKIRTLRQIVDGLVRTGRITHRQSQRLITVHSLSKTDCYAGGRLCIVEIPDSELRNRYKRINSGIIPNTLAILIAYLFYRNEPERVHMFWRRRNEILSQRMDAMERALGELPAERNPFGITLSRPEGAMYPHLVIDKLPHGISLDWLAKGLASQGIGLIPLTTFARTAQGFDLARKTFRLSLGGVDDANSLYIKTRRMLIDLNRLIAEESAQYKRKSLPAVSSTPHILQLESGNSRHFDDISEKVAHLAGTIIRKMMKLKANRHLDQAHLNRFIGEHLPGRLDGIRQRYMDRLSLTARIQGGMGSREKDMLMEILDKELYKDSLIDRRQRFRQRLYDRTVHPTQMYSLKVDLHAEEIIESLTGDVRISEQRLQTIASALVQEYMGTNVAIRSVDEADELVLDMKTMIAAEDQALWQNNVDLTVFLSFWGDWDGSTRPSGQGHRLVAAALLENVTQLSRFLLTLLNVDSNCKVEPGLLAEIQQLDKRMRNFWKLLNDITALTNQLEKRYQHLMPFDINPGRWRKAGMAIGLAKDPMTALWQHNDRLERKMLKLRSQRSQNLEYYFSLNKRLRKTLHTMLPHIGRHLTHPELCRVAGLYRDILKRFVLTPRIHQKMILSTDQFAIDTTVHNLMEINEISGKYGNPGMVMALQISMSNTPDAVIALDRKMRTRREEILRDMPEAVIPPIWLVPLFEDADTIQGLEDYYGALWEYAVQSRKLKQKTGERYAEMLCEVFFAGSDLSQMVSQTAGAALYKEAKHRTVKWLAERGLVGEVRIKFGSGEPMQRQGGFYDTQSGEPVLNRERKNEKELRQGLKESSFRSLSYATSPLRGILSGGEFRTFQSNIAEHMRRLSIEDLKNLLYHVRETQRFQEDELIRAAEPLLDTRLQFERRGWKELQRLTLGYTDESFQEFTQLITDNFQQIVYGRSEDVVGIHAVSYFVSRTIPTLRDRPTVRPSRSAGSERGQEIVQKLAQTLPLCTHGSLLRAIGHNRAQTMILGINQLTTGMFRALQEFTTRVPNGQSYVRERILPKLPVHEILHTLRTYHDRTLECIQSVENAFVASNSALLALREDNDSIPHFISDMQKELLRRQGLDASDFFSGDRIISELLPAIRPDIAVLLQPDLFNTDLDQIYHSNADSAWSAEMQRLLSIPLQVRSWRSKIWDMICDPIFSQVRSFNELAIAIYSLSGNRGAADLSLSMDTNEVFRMGAEIADLLKRESDDSMRQFLITAVKYLTQLPKQMAEVPIDVIRALRDVENIIKIDEQALNQAEQDMLRFYVLNIARLCGENG
jgi:aspartate/methionine/tyrosine aminotransferase